MSNKTKAHTRYRNKAGDIVCGVTWEKDNFNRDWFREDVAYYERIDEHIRCQMDFA